MSTLFIIGIAVYAVCWIGLIYMIRTSTEDDPLERELQEIIARSTLDRKVR
jgi:hypothetical protein